MNLNTIIEEQKKKARVETQNHCQKRYEGILQQEVIDGTVSYWGKRTDTLLTYAMPRAYETGRADWLRSEIERLEEELEIQKAVQEKAKQVVVFGRARVAGMVADKYTRIGKIDALTSIITRYKEELKELTGE